MPLWDCRARLGTAGTGPRPCAPRRFLAPHTVHTVEIRLHDDSEVRALRRSVR